MRLLIIEDDAKIAEFVCRGFREAGFRATRAGDGEEGLGVAFAGCPHYGSGVFEHRDEEGIDEGGCEEVFVGAEDVGSLPYPLSGVEGVAGGGEGVCLLVVAPVAGPYADVAPCESLTGCEGRGEVARPGCVGLDGKGCE